MNNRVDCLVFANGEHQFVLPTGMVFEIATLNEPLRQQKDKDGLFLMNWHSRDIKAVVLDPDVKVADFKFAIIAKPIHQGGQPIGLLSSAQPSLLIIYSEQILEEQSSAFPLVHSDFNYQEKLYSAPDFEKINAY